MIAHPFFLECICLFGGKNKSVHVRLVSVAARDLVLANEGEAPTTDPRQQSIRLLRRLGMAYIFRILHCVRSWDGQTACI